jgi:hypothetical protein
LVAQPLWSFCVVGFIPTFFRAVGFEFSRAGAVGLIAVVVFLFRIWFFDLS